MKKYIVLWKDGSFWRSGQGEIAQYKTPEDADNYVSQCGAKHDMIIVEVASATYYSAKEQLEVDV